MAIRSPKHGLTRTKRGWVKRINRKPRWIVSDKLAPTPQAADEWYEKHFTAIWQAPAGPVADPVGAVTVGYLADAWHERKSRSTLDPGSKADYDAVTGDFVMALGREKLVDELTPADFARVRAVWARRFGPHRLRKYLKALKAMFRWAMKPPLRLRETDYGDEFDEPGRVDIRKHEKATRDKHGVRLFTPEEIVKILARVNVNLRAMVLLALNGGFGNTDVCELPLSVLDLAGGFLDYARRKTGIDRRVPLWPQTIEALRAVLAERGKLLAALKLRGRTLDPAAEGLVFVTMFGRPYLKRWPSGRKNDQLGGLFNEVLKELGMARLGRNF